MGMVRRTGNGEAEEDFMGDLKDPRVMALKAALFVVIGLLGAGMVLLELPSLKVAALLTLTVWSFSRAYYFAFYVVGHYIDPGYKFAGLGAAVMHVVRMRKSGKSVGRGGER